jgi:hypothetical protein
MLRGLLNGVSGVVHAVAVARDEIDHYGSTSFFPMIIEQYILSYGSEEAGAVEITKRYLPLCGAPISSLMPVRVKGKSRLPLTTSLPRVTCPACLVAIDEMLEAELIAVEEASAREARKLPMSPARWSMSETTGPYIVDRTALPEYDDYEDVDNDLPDDEDEDE